MATYTYECPKCKAIAEINHSVHATPYVACTFCNLECSKVILQAPSVRMPFDARAVPSKNYYGKDPLRHINVIEEKPEGGFTIHTTNPNGPEILDD